MREPTTFVVGSATSVVIASPPRCRRADGLDDVLVARAPAEVPLEAAPDLDCREPVAVRAQEVDAGHDHAGRAEAALESVMLPERLLQRMQLAVRREALDRRDLAAVGLDREHGARLDRVPVQLDRAGAADGRVAADLRTGEAEAVAKEVDQQ